MEGWKTSRVDSLKIRCFHVDIWESENVFRNYCIHDPLLVMISTFIYPVLIFTIFLMSSGTKNFPWGYSINSVDNHSFRHHIYSLHTTNLTIPTYFDLCSVDPNNFNFLFYHNSTHIAAVSAEICAIFVMFLGKFHLHTFILCSILGWIFINYISRVLLVLHLDKPDIPCAC